MAKSKPAKKPKPSLSDQLKSEAAKAVELTEDRLLAFVRKKRRTTEQISEEFRCKPALVKRAISAMQERGVLIYLLGDEWGIERTPAAGDAVKQVYRSRSDNTYLFGLAADAHLCSKYERLDVLNDLYDRFAAAGVDRVFNSGNWIDGEANFNRQDLNVHGMDNQVEYLAETFPQRDGIVTYSVAGDDHEGWYAQREGVDIGRHAERVLSDAGRTDWVNMGYMEAFVTLRNAATNKSSQLLLMHPGGGSAYATSYKPQKIVESFAGGEKPAVLLIGHYHKLSLNLIRGVWAIQCGCQQDQTPFMRKKGIDAHVGGCICRLEQDPQTGAIIGCRVELLQYFNTGYYNDRWNRGRPVTLPERRLGRE